MNYEVIETSIGLVIKRTDSEGDIAWIPTDPANSDYTEYLAYTAWVDEGNDPDEFWNRNQELI